MSGKSVISDTIGTARELVGNNKKATWLGLIALAVASWRGWIDIGLPKWWPIAAGAIALAYLIGREAAKRIDELLPDEQGILLVSYGGERIDELSEDQFAEMTVDGSLYQWDESPRRTYECVSYDKAANHAVANWKESFPGSEVGAEETPADAIAIIEEFRKDFEPELADARELKRRIRGVVRELDKDRAEAHDALVDDHVAPDMGDSRSVGEVLKEVVPDDMHPYGGDHDETTGAEEIADDLDVEDGAGGDAGQQQAATDGGEIDDE